MSEDLKAIADRLTDKQRAAILLVEQEGNGKHFYQIHGLAKLGLMSLQPIPALMDQPAYRLNTLGKAVRATLIESSGEGE